MRILLLGKNGQLGWELQRSLSVLGELIPLDRSHAGGDLLKLNDVRSGIQKLRPDVIVNAAAYTSVDKAELEFDLAYRINAEAPSLIAQAAAEINALLIHYSTDYVFPGNGHAPWRETDKPAPLSVYGKTKLEGESAIQASGCEHLIFRTSWVYGIRGANFARTILGLLREREVLTIVNDQFGVPTGAEFIADVTAHAIWSCRLDGPRCGIYHVAAAGETTWWEYACYVSESAQKLAPEIPWICREIRPISTADFPAIAKRPLNSRLNTQKMQNAFGLSTPNWKHGVKRFLIETLAKQGP